MHYRTNRRHGPDQKYVNPHGTHTHTLISYLFMTQRWWPREGKKICLTNDYLKHPVIKSHKNILLLLQRPGLPQKFRNSTIEWPRDQSDQKLLLPKQFIYDIMTHIYIYIYNPLWTLILLTYYHLILRTCSSFSIFFIQESLCLFTLLLYTFLGFESTLVYIWWFNVWTRVERVERSERLNVFQRDEQGHM